MISNKKFDYIILGGGCSAFSLINEIIKKNITDYSFIIIEKRKEYTDDRSWCFWDRNDTKYKNIVEKSWNSFSFNFNGKSNYLKSKKYKYHYIRSINFYENIMKKILTFPNIKLNLDENVIQIKKRKDYFLVKTDKSNYKANKILDTRPNLKAFKKYPFMYQTFLGYEIYLKNNINLKIDNAYLMDKMSTKNNNYCFNYILPLNKNNILFEFTVFSNKSVSLPWIENELLINIKKYNLGSYKIVRREYGKLPMGFTKNNETLKCPNYYKAGTAAGAIRASSGYAFLRIQDWAEKCAINIKKKGNLINHHKEKNMLYFIDRIFLIAISNKTVSCPVIFFNFSKKIFVDTFIKFMLGKVNFFDCIKVILSMPKRVFLRCLFKI